MLVRWSMQRFDHRPAPASGAVAHSQQCLQDQSVRLFSRAATAEKMSIAMALEIFVQPDFNFLPDCTTSQTRTFSTYARVSFYQFSLPQFMSRALRCFALQARLRMA